MLVKSYAVLKTLGSALLDFVFPPFCSLCREGLSDGERIVCEACWAKVALLSGPQCPRCGAPSTGDDRCPNCAGRDYRFSGACVLASFDEGAQALIHLLKYREKTSVGVRFGRMLGEAVKADPRMSGVDRVLPVPLHRSRVRERGYNQSDLIARGVGEALGRPVEARALARTRATRTQTELSGKERAQNVSGAFIVRRPERVAGLRLLLVDDVFTTGATLDACAGVLLDAGAVEVFVAAVASPFRK
ncbi:MAG: ComF family protein [Candidatus Latescibacteria bacterium]|nr:ComF family protein [Candidatus Latescibacterota bacterium]